MRWLLLASTIALSACSSEAGSPPTDPGTSDQDAGVDPLATMPDPLTMADGSRVTTKAQWPARREEILELFRANVYGRSPGPPEQFTTAIVEEDPQAMGGAATLRRVSLQSQQAGRTLSFELILFLPNAATGPVPAFVLVNTRKASNTDPTRTVKDEFWPAEEVIASGHAIAAYQADDLAPDDPATFMNGAIRLYEGDSPGLRPADAWKAIGAWSWGASRVMDYLETDARVDAARVAIIGHSRGGKAALWAGAQDERFRVTISNESGCAGAALSRRPIGENVALITGVYPYWFADRFQTYANAEDTLPVDQHELLALVAPRGLFVGSASNDTWSDPEGEYLGLAYASPVFALFGFAPVDPAGWPAIGAAVDWTPRHYHLREGDHDLVLWDWERYVAAADPIWGP